MRWRAWCAFSSPAHWRSSGSRNSAGTRQRPELSWNPLLKKVVDEEDEFSEEEDDDEEDEEEDNEALPPPPPPLPLLCESEPV